MSAGSRAMDAYRPFVNRNILDAYERYAELRVTAPVYWSEEDGLYYAFSFDAVHEALLDQERLTVARTKSRVRYGGQLGSLREMQLKWFIQMDPPEHTPLRRFFGQWFTPKRIDQLEGWVRTVAHSLLDDVTEAGSMDLVAYFAYPLPSLAIATVLGVPTEDIHLFKEWGSRLAKTQESYPSEDQIAASNAAIEDAHTYFEGLVDERKRHPGEDIISFALAERDERELSDCTLIANAFLILVAGHETTINLIGNTVNALLERPDQQARIWLGAASMSKATEEFLRFDSPVQMTSRVVNVTHELEGVQLEEGRSIVLVLGSANREELAFPSADVLDVDRWPNQHMAFGGGIHHCLGARLARLEGRIALETMTRRIDGIAPAGAPRRLDLIELRGFSSLPISFDTIT
jgi:cytochrome P450